jgi:hypothetical protein
MSKKLTSNKALVVIVVLVVAGMVAMLYSAVTANPINTTADPTANLAINATVPVSPAEEPVEPVEPVGQVETVGGPPGITPAKVFVNELTPGIEATYILTICNNSHDATTFSVGYRYPDFVADGYAKPSSDVPGWIHISETLPTVPAHSTKNIEITLLVPSNATAPGKLWEFWIGVIDQSQTGMVQVELCQRWQVTMS